MRKLGNELMLKIFILFLFFQFAILPTAYSQMPTDSLLTSNIEPQKSLKISILTCGAGEDLYSIYGHSAIRVIERYIGPKDIAAGFDSDIVYNYGTFNFSDPDFYWKFTRGKLLYYVNDDAYDGFISMYQHEGRSIEEQVLDLNNEDAKSIQDFLINNLKEENKYYKYDFLLDNCSTRLRDIFSKQFGNRFQLGKIIANDSVSFRTILNFYERNLHWERVGINLLMSNVVDNKMTNEQSTFLPDYLFKALALSTLDGKPIVKETHEILPNKIETKPTTNLPYLYAWILFWVVLFISFTPFKKFLIYFDILFFLLLGLLGCFMLFMWFGTEHIVCAYNRNLLWAFPLHVVFAFLIPRENKMKKEYAKYASMLLIASMIYSLFAEQKYISEIIPILFIIIFRLRHYRGNSSFVFRKFSA